MTTIINLDTGELVEGSGAQPVINEPEALELIDLESGSIQVQQPRRLLGKAASAKQESVEPTEPTRAIKELPELVESGILSEADKSTVFKIAPAILTATNPEEIANILTTNFPEIGIIQDEQGNLIAGNNKTGVEAVINKPGASPIDILQTLGIGAAFTPAAQVATAPAKILAAPAAKFAAGATTAGLTQAGIEALQGELGGELNGEEIAIASALGGVAEVVVPAIQALRQSKISKEADQAGAQIEDVANQVTAANQASEETGVRLFQAQKTTIPAQLEKQSFISQLPAGTRKASSQLAKQNKEAAQAVNDFLELIAPDDAVVTGAERIRTAAQTAIDKAKQIRSERASPLYREAFESDANVELIAVLSRIDEELIDAPSGGEIAKSLLKVKKFLEGDKTLKQLHNAKLEIDQMIAKPGENSLGNTTKSKLLDIQQSLLEEMDAASPAYKSAREEFAAASPSVTKLQESIIGKISKIDDTQLKNISRRIFDPAETNPQIIRQAKKIIEDVDPDAWNRILRTELERRLGVIKSTLEEGTTENVPGQMFRALFGNDKQRKVLFNSVDGEAKRNLRYLEIVLSRARLGRNTGSQTAAREEIKRELRGGPSQAIREFFGRPMSSIANAGVTTITGVRATASFDNRVRALADIMFDPQWQPRLKELRKLDTDSPAAGRAMIQLLDDAISADYGNLSSPEQPEKE